MTQAMENFDSEDLVEALDAHYGEIK